MTSTLKIANQSKSTKKYSATDTFSIKEIGRRIYRKIMEAGARSYPYRDSKTSLDSNGFTVRRSPSYVAWKIKKATGKWLAVPDSYEDEDFNVEDWTKILEYNGWIRQKQGPIDNSMSFIGIIQKEDIKEVQIVWLEKIETVVFFRKWVVSTYQDDKETHYVIPSNNDKIIWYGREKICKNL